jgi:hypothetical protein
MTSVDMAARYARQLVGREMDRTGDLEVAMRQVEAKTGIGYWTLWGLWHKRRKLIDRDLFGRLRGAYLALCERQVAALQHELAVEKARGGDDTFEDLASEAELLAKKIRSARGRAR